MKLITFYKLYYDHRLKKSKFWLKIYLILTIPIKYLVNLPFVPKKKNLDLMAQKFPDFFNKNLDFLFEFFNSDKGNYYIDQYRQPIKRNNKKIDAHGYSEIYENFFFKKKNEHLNILELGSFYGNAAASLFFYFKNSKIFSTDIYPDLFRYQSKRIENFFIDNSSELSIKNVLLNKDISYDIIIEDACHAFKDQIISLFMLFKKLNRGALFIVEELDHPDTRDDRNINNEHPTLREILNLINDNQNFDSKYILAEDKEYFLKNYEYIKIFKGKTNEIAIIKKND